jgi:FkbM family methyltransferase
MRAPDKTQSLKVLRSRNVPIETIIDVGVHASTAELIGTFADKLHLLFEPVREFVSDIHANYKNLNYTLVEAAVSDREGEVTLQTGSHGSSAMINYSNMVSGPADSIDKRTVPMVTLDGHLSRHPQKPPYLVKLDVDGFELQVMQGAVETLKNTSVVVVETTKRDLTERISFLEARGFEIFDLVEPCYYDQAFWQCDAVLLKRSLLAEYFSNPDDFSPAKYEMFHLVSGRRRSAATLFASLLKRCSWNSLRRYSV